MVKLILALDQGTTSSRAILFNHKGNIKGMAQKEFAQLFPKPGWVEHNPMEIWSSQLEVIHEALKVGDASGQNIAAIGITNQRETAIVWDRSTGKPIHNAIVWQDRRTSSLCDTLKAEGKETLVRDKTGLLIDAYFSGTKVKWILDSVPNARAQAQRGELAFGTVDSWLVWNLTKGRTHVTDISNASRTMLFNIHTLEWDDELLALFDIPRSILPRVVPSSDVYEYAHESYLGAKVPISGIAGDQQAALFGQMCVEPGMIKSTYGTGCFILMNTGSKPFKSHNQLLTTIAWRIGNEVTYALEGSIFVAGAAVQWLRDGLGIIGSSSEVEALARQVNDSGGVYFVPSLAGLGAPYWDPYARGTIVGITRGTSRAHIARATLEGIAFQTMDVIGAMGMDTKIGTKELRVDGGASANNLLMQLQADILNTTVVRPQIQETTALGAAYLAGLATGYWSDVNELKSHWKLDTTFYPSLPACEAERLRARWGNAVSRARGWAQGG